ncbi:MAG TPA: hypothetical protein VEG65_01925 [Candidatus Bathyarchaeia archaeon]|nr:hypothetical protein [Candidatus Bathyarchaeia archaeon]
MPKGWCRNCQFQNIQGALYCSQCGEQLEAERQPLPRFGSVTIAILLAWLLFVGGWLAFFAGGFSIVQNTAVFFASFAVMLILEVIVIMPRGKKQPT